MATTRIELKGQRFLNLVVIAFDSIGPHGHVLWKCLCDCGKEFIAYGASINSGKTKSCSECGYIRGGKLKIKHGKRFTTEYVIWSKMKDRCLNNKNPRFKDYGGRGIKICERWLGEDGFINFFEDMGCRPVNMSLDRMNNNLGYDKSNCRWASQYEQTRNQRTNHWIEFDGKRMILSDWASYYNISISQMYRNTKNKTMKEVDNFYTNKRVCKK